MQKILITGGSGFIGNNMVQYLLDKGNIILNVDKMPPINTKNNQYWENVNILDSDRLEQIILKFDPHIIIHFAAVTDLNGKDEEYYRANTTGTQNIIDIAGKLKNLKKVIFTSSMYVCKPGIIPTDYETYKPHTLYGESKVAGELLVKAIKNNTYQWVIIRPTSIWGPWFNIPYIDFFETVYKGKYFDFGKSCTKTYGFVGNAIYQISQLINSDSANHSTFYIGDLPPTQINEWANEISIQMNKGKIKKIPFLLIKLASWYGDLLKIGNIKFTITSFRLKNMTTNNILPLKDIYKVAGEPPYTRQQGNIETLEWLKSYKGYKL